MVLTEELRCLWTLGLCLVAGRSPARAPAADRRFRERCLDAHNALRARVLPPAADMRHLSWDDGLAKTAKAWANTCRFEHNSCLSKSYECHPTFQYIGENIWLGGLSIFSPKSAVDAWFNETEYYDYDTLSCTKVCGHYTQVVWANSYKVGCAVTMCPKLGGYETVIFVCNYGPAGNYPNRPPYTRGVPCSLCTEEETCTISASSCCMRLPLSPDDTQSDCLVEAANPAHCNNTNSSCVKPCTSPKHVVCARNKKLEKYEKYPDWNPQGTAPQHISCNPLCLVLVLLRLF